VKFYLTRLDIS